MATETKPPAGQAAAPVEGEPVGQQSLIQKLIVSVATQSWLASLVIHMAAIIFLALVLGTIKATQIVINSPIFESDVEEVVPETEIEHFVVGETPIDPTELSTETLTLDAPPVEAQFNDNSEFFEEAGGGIAGAESEFGGLGGFTVSASGMGPVFKGKGGVDAGGGFGKNFGKGGAGTGFGSRGSGMREAMLGTGGTKASERAVAAALNWLARHQRPDGSWSLDHLGRCKGGGCTGPGNAGSDSGATALALLPFLAAGQTHQSKGPYQKNIAGGLNWLIKNQKPDGDLSNGGSQMYSHGLATIALCEAYGMTQDSRIGINAQLAINFIESGQNAQGSWRYTHGSADSDTSVFGWQVMALKSGQMAGLKVNLAVLEGCQKYLDITATGNYKHLFGYQPGTGPTLPMTSVGLLTSQYLGAKRGDPVVMGGVEFLMSNLPKVDDRNVYNWYYATQVMHNVPGPQWDKWNREMRKLLINTQEKNGCAAGSWSPDKPTKDAWGDQGGRLMVTSLSALTLEVYYRYLPLYQLDKPEEGLELEKTK
jgi:hypothetical protein